MSSDVIQHIIFNRLAYEAMNIIEWLHIELFTWMTEKPFAHIIMHTIHSVFGLVVVVLFCFFAYHIWAYQTYKCILLPHTKPNNRTKWKHHSSNTSSGRKRNRQIYTRFFFSTSCSILHKTSHNTIIIKTKCKHINIIA